MEMQNKCPASCLHAAPSHSYPWLGSLLPTRVLLLCFCIINPCSSPIFCGLSQEVNYVCTEMPIMSLAARLCCSRTRGWGIGCSKPVGWGLPQTQEMVRAGHSGLPWGHCQLLRSLSPTPGSGSPKAFTSDLAVVVQPVPTAPIPPPHQQCGRSWVLTG